MLQREVQGHATSERVPHQMCPVNLQVVEQTQQVVGNVVSLLWSRRFSEWTNVVANDTELFRERGHLRVPTPAIHEPPV